MKSTIWPHFVKMLCGATVCVPLQYVYINVCVTGTQMCWIWFKLSYVIQTHRFRAMCVWALSQPVSTLSHPSWNTGLYLFPQKVSCHYIYLKKYIMLTYTLLKTEENLLIRPPPTPGLYLNTKTMLLKRNLPLPPP